MAALTRFHDAVLGNNEEVAKKLMDDGVDPNGILEVCTCQNSCHGYTLLYMACVHDRMTVVKMLLEAGADPDRCNRNDSTDIFHVNTPFVFVIIQRNNDLLRVLMRESKVCADLQYAYGSVTGWRVPYGLFCQHHENEDVIKVLMDGESIGPGGCFPYNHGNFANLLREAAKQRSSEVYKVLLDHCGVDELVEAVNEYMNSAETMSYLIDVYGARRFVEENLKEVIMRHGSTAMFEMLMGYFYQLYGDSRERWMELMMTSWAPRYPSIFCYMYSVMEKSIAFSNDGDGKSRFNCLLRWGLYDVHPEDDSHSVFIALAQAGMIESVRVLISLYPQCLQEQWLQNECKPWTGLLRRRKELEVEEYFATLVEKRRHPPKLELLCRSVIFHELGINPIPKAERLPLPRILKDFVQCKELFETDD